MIIFTILENVNNNTEISSGETSSESIDFSELPLDEIIGHSEAR